jgi:hypothetical protein
MRRGRDFDDDIKVEIPRTLNMRYDRVRWSAVLAGVVTALTSLLLLSLLGIAIGLTTVNAGTAAAQGAPPPDIGRNFGIWGAAAALISFLLGGFVAARTAAVFDRTWGALNGTLVFLLGLPIILWLAAQGMGFALGTFAQGLNLDPASAQNLANQAGQTAQQAQQQVQPVDVARAAEGARNAAWSALIVSLLGLAAGALGGFLGTRRELEIDRATGKVTE